MCGSAENTHGVFYVTAFVKRYCGGVVFFEASSCAHCKVAKAVAVIAIGFRKLLALWINAGIVMLAVLTSILASVWPVRLGELYTMISDGSVTSVSDECSP